MRLVATILLIIQLLARSLAVQHGHAPSECGSHGVDHDVRSHLHIGFWGGHAADHEHVAAARHDHSHTATHSHTASDSHSHQESEDRYCETQPSSVLADPLSVTLSSESATNGTPAIERVAPLVPRRASPPQDSFVIHVGSAVLAAPEPRVPVPSFDASFDWIATADPFRGILPDRAKGDGVSSRQADACDGRFLFLAHMLRI